jgi:hypothetical protein
VINDPPPLAQLISNTQDSGINRMHIRLSSPRQAAQLEVMLACENPEVIRNATINGEQIPLNYSGTGKNRLIYIPVYALPVSKQIDLTVDLAPANKLQIILCDKSIGLPDSFVKHQRPDWVIPEQGNYSNITTIAKSYSISIDPANKPF